MKRSLDLGCGKKKHKGCIGADINKDSDADVICDLNRYPYPFSDNAFDIIYCIGILEHVNNVFKTMDEIYRICKKKAHIMIRVPFISSLYLGIDPSHKRGFTSQSFDFFVEGTKLRKQYPFYTRSKFNIIEIAYDKRDLKGKRHWWDRLILSLANKFKKTYESRFRYLFPVTEIYFRLEAIKDA